MNVTTIELKKLTASSGMVLTNGKAYGTEIYLGKTDSPDNWWEISEAEYEKIIEEEERRLENNVT